MKLGILTDIHESVGRLDLALERLRREGVERIVFLGDLVDTGDRLDEAAARLIEAGVVGVWGNHEIGLCVDPSDEMRARYAGPGLEFLSTLQGQMVIDGCLLCHALPQHDPADVFHPWYIDQPPATVGEAATLFASVSQRVIFGGHYHRWLAVDEDGPLPWDGSGPLRLEPPGRWFVVVHAVCDGWCATYDTETFELTPIRLVEESAGPATGVSPSKPVETPGSLLDQIRDHPEWDDAHREQVLDRLVSRFPADSIRAALDDRIANLDGPEGGVILRLVEAFGTEATFAALAEALVAALDDLPPERTWEALAVLEGTEQIDAHPELAERLEELVEILDEDEDSIGELAEQLAADPEGIWTALHGLGPVEPEYRVSILEGLARQPSSPGLVEFFRLLAHCPEPSTSHAALGALVSLFDLDPAAGVALARLAVEHPDSAVGARVAGCLAGRPLDRVHLGQVTPVRCPTLVAARLTGLDDDGRGILGLAAEEDGSWVAAAFLCDMTSGIVDVHGLLAPGELEARAFLQEAMDEVGGGVELATPEHGPSLLANALLRSGPTTPPALRYWIERTAGSAVRPEAFVPAAEPGWEPSAVPPDALAVLARKVLDACPSWLDESKLTREIALELLLREGGSGPDRERDSGALRFLFEGRLRDRVGVDLAMLAWMSTFWRASGLPDLSHAASVLAGQLSEAQNVVPGHPYLVELATRSLAAAQRDLRRELARRNRGLGASS